MANHSTRKTAALLSFALVSVVIAVCIFPTFVHAQVKPTITYTLDFPGSDPAHYVLTIGADGHGNYHSDGRLFLQAESGERSQIDFTLSPATKTKIFDLARQVRASDQRKENHKIASTGTKTFRYDDGHNAVKITYDYSPVAHVRDLTVLFQHLSNTLEFGRRLQYEHQYQKLALDDDMKRMDEQFQGGMLLDVRAITPILQKILDDPSVMNVARMRAQRLLLADPDSQAGPRKSD